MVTKEPRTGEADHRGLDCDGCERFTTRYQSSTLLDHVISVFRDGTLVEELARQFVTGLLNHLGSVQPDQLWLKQPFGRDLDGLEIRLSVPRPR
jgi:hypothetical protein